MPRSSRVRSRAAGGKMVSNEGVGDRLTLAVVDQLRDGGVEGQPGVHRQIPFLTFNTKLTGYE